MRYAKKVHFGGVARVVLRANVASVLRLAMLVVIVADVDVNAASC